MVCYLCSALLLQILFRHLHKHLFVHLSAFLLNSSGCIGSNSGFNILPKDTLTCILEKTPTFPFVATSLLPEPQLPDCSVINF